MSGYKRIIDFPKLWHSKRLLACPVDTRGEYEWLYGLADARGSFEMEPADMIRHEVGAIRPDLTNKKIEQCLEAFEKNGLLFIWQAEGKSWGHWVSSTKPGRLPSRAQLGKAHYKVETPAVPLAGLQAYCEEHGVNLKHWPEGGDAELEEKAEIVTGINLRPYTDYAVETFTARFGHKPTWKHDFVLFANLVKQHKFELETFKRIWDLYLADEDPWVRDKQGHSLAWFCKKFDAYLHRIGVENSTRGELEEKSRLAADAERQLGEMRERECVAGAGGLDEQVSENFFNG